MSLMTGTIRAAIARAGFKLSGWRHLPGVVPGTSGPSILIGAPHTSNWDFIFMLGITWDLGIKTKFLGKHTLFKPPFGFIMRWLGGIPVERSQAHGLVDQIVSATQKDPSFSLVVTPEGTRGAGTYWKSGFYRISLQAGMPIILGYLDRATKTCGLGVEFTPTGDVHKDMDFIRAFYADKGGYKPHLKTEPRLREEDEQPGN